jgi:uncharacterized protein
VRNYQSVYRRIEEAERRLKEYDKRLAEMFRRCYPNTLETTTELLEDGTTFVFTGDIPAMWLRDSSAQIRPYMDLAAEDEELQRAVRGLIMRQAGYLLIDPYANAFNKEPNGSGHQSDHTIMSPWIWERKFELDSLCYPVQLCKDYWDATGDASIFGEQLRRMFHTVIRTMRTEQRHDRDSAYRFEREELYLPTDTLPFGGRGTGTNFTGMVWSGFRPSDDACRFGYLVPSNMFAVVVLGHIIEFAETIYRDETLADEADRLRKEIDFGIETYGIVTHPTHGRMYAYETDGFGNYNLMDDANVPSLLSIPYLGYKPADDPIYRNTRRFVLSPDNPYYNAGSHARGIGSPHTPAGYVWPIGLIMQGLTSEDQAEQARIVAMLAETTAGTGFMHESFDPDDPAVYTRPWFAWANSLFGEFIWKWLQGQSTEGSGWKREGSVDEKSTPV